MSILLAKALRVSFLASGIGLLISAPGGLAHGAIAGNDPANWQVRFYGGAQSIAPADLNNLIKSQGLNEHSVLPVYGFEGAYFFFDRIGLGGRIEGSYVQANETAIPSANPANPYFSSFHRTTSTILARLALINSSLVKLDIFGGVGSSQGSFDVRTAAGEGTYEAKNNFGAKIYGASVSIGWSNIFLVAEAGQRQDALEVSSRSGFTNSQLNSIDLSGSYVSLGLNFSGLPSFVHMK